MAEQINTNTEGEKGEFKLTFLTAEDIIKRQQEAVAAQSHLMVQTLDNFDASLLTPLNPDIISRQATINIGTIGHVAHGKSTLVLAVSGTNVRSRTLTHADCSPFAREEA